MNEYTNFQSNSPRRRLSGEISLIGANCRDFEHKEKLNVLERKLEREIAIKEKKLKRSQKWDSRVEKNLILKEIYSSSSKLHLVNQPPLSPSIDEWLQMSHRKKSAIAASSQKNKPK